MENARKLKLHGSQKEEEVNQSSYDKSVAVHPPSFHPSIHPSIALCAPSSGVMSK
jgi:hypothetical protein